MVERIDLSRRAELTESMDSPCSYEDLRGCLRDLAWVNRLTMAHRPVMEWLERFARLALLQRDQTRALRIVDVGCGYGDMLRGVERWAARRGLPVELVGIDVNANAVRAAREATPAESGIEWINADVYSCARAADADLITACGMTHHLSEIEIVRQLAWMEASARAGWCIVDLHRKPVPYRIFGEATRIGWWHRFIRPDGLRSIRRSFLAEDWQRMCSAAGLESGDVEIVEFRPARLCVERTKRQAG